MSKDSRLDSLLTRFAQRDRLALARLITLVENRAPAAVAVMDKLYSLSGRAHVIGITGPPGAGKSTLINLIIRKLRSADQLVAVLAIDPSSPFSGGAVLGDRVRMTDHYRDTGVYIRSISTRGSRGGLSRAAREIVRLLDAFGHGTIIIETVGVGQTELDVMDLADTVVVVTVPEGGDSVQVMKAGLNEIADLFVVNKADRDGADRLKAELELSVHLRDGSGWRAPVMLVQANADRGVEELLAEIARHREYQAAHRDPDRVRDRRAHEFIEVLTSELDERARRGISNGGAPGLLDAVREGEVNPYSAARRIMDDRTALDKILALRQESR
ncbi:MAG: methylmalonyl Co-A mutase-associated GTPase MeaB [Candidatus Binataceae bacterium]|nr:methylmalonyl Co-A mutase-associated GTPase MeaB [Candidatus Binataceae bacterium]